MQRRILFSALLAVGLFTASMLAAYAQPSELGSSDRAHLSRLAEQYLYDRANRITANAVESDDTRLTSTPTTAALSVRLAVDAARIDERREVLHRINDGYSHAQVNVDVTNIDVNGEIVTLAVIEHTKLFYPSVPEGAPEAEEYVLARDLVFVRESGNWLLHDSTIAESGDALLPVTEHWNDAAATADVAPPELQPSSTERVVVHEHDADATPQGEMIVPSYNRAAMVRYALQYWRNYNDEYRAYSNDCTNFISQAIYAGGWTYVGGVFDREENSAWFYGSFTWTTSYTWAGAENWRWFAIGSGRTYILSNGWDMRAADVLQVDWDRNGNINHTMIVTNKDSSGEIYLTYHTTNTRNKKLSTLLAQYGNAWWYAHRI